MLVTKPFNLLQISNLVFLDAVADVVELGEGSGHLVHELAEWMEEEVVWDLDDHLRKSKQNFGELQLALVLQADWGLLDVGHVDVRIPENGSHIVQQF